MLAGCVLFVSGEPYGTTCRFAGEGTACGTCVSAQCQTAVNACCADDACAPALADLDACAQGDVTACKHLAMEQGKESSARATLAACVTGTCHASCRMGTNLTRCTLPILGSGTTCHCELSAQATDQGCDAKTFPDTLCCAPESWPQEGQRCSCRKLQCGSTGNGCFCRLKEDTTLNRPECAGTYCCVQHQDCTCGAQPCGVGQRAVPACTISFSDCGPGEKVVDTCTVTSTR